MSQWCRVSILSKNGRSSLQKTKELAQKKKTPTKHHFPYISHGSDEVWAGQLCGDQREWGEPAPVFSLLCLFCVGQGCWIGCKHLVRRPLRIPTGLIQWTTANPFPRPFAVCYCLMPLPILLNFGISFALCNSSATSLNFPVNSLSWNWQCPCKH